MFAFTVKILDILWPPEALTVSSMFLSSSIIKSSRMQFLGKSSNGGSGAPARRCGDEGDQQVAAIVDEPVAHGRPRGLMRTMIVAGTRVLFGESSQVFTLSRNFNKTS